MIGETIRNFVNDTGIVHLDYKSAIMIVVACVFLYLAINKGFEPLLLIPIGFGMLLSNLPLTGIFVEHVASGAELSQWGIFTIFYTLKPILPSLIFLGVGAMTYSDRKSVV